MERTLRGLLARAFFCRLPIRVRFHVVVLGVLVLTDSAWAQPSGQVPDRTADEYLAKGLSLYERDQFDQAILEFHAGYQASGRPEFLFAIAQAMRRSGDCAGAITYYQKFVAKKPPAKQVEAARMHIRGCRQEMAGPSVTEARGAGGAPDIRKGSTGQRGRKAGGTGRSSSGGLIDVDTGQLSASRTPASARPAAPEGTAPSPSAGAGAAPRSVPQEADTGSDPMEVVTRPGYTRRPIAPWYHDMVGDVLLGTGVAGATLGIGLLVASGKAHDSARAASTYLDYDLHVNRAQRYRIWGVVSLASASVMIAGSLYRFYRHGEAEEGHSISVTPLSGGVIFSYGGEL